MILNAYSVLDGFVVLLRIATSLLVVGLGIAALRHGRRGVLVGGDPSIWENRLYLLLLGSLLLVGLNLASWPLLYLLLQSYVPQWPGVMCIYGVTRIGDGSAGPSRFLPGLLSFVQAAKPSIVFGSGAWFVAYRLSRLTRSARYGWLVAATQTGVGVLSLADATAEAAYLVIPKMEQSLYSGCCTTTLGPTSRAAHASPIDEDNRFGLSTAYFVVHGGLVLAASATLWRTWPPGAIPSLAPLALGAIVGLGVGATFLVEVAAPTVLHLPYHRCAYDLVPRAPDIVAAVGLFTWGTFSCGWAYLAGRLAAPAALVAAGSQQVRRLLTMGRNAYLAALTIVVLAMALA